MRKIIFFFCLFFVTCLLSCGPTIVEYKKIVEYRTPHDSTFVGRYLDTIFDIIKQTYLDSARIDSEKLVYGAAKGMIEALGDTYSMLYTPKEIVSRKKEEEKKHAQYIIRDSIAIITIPAFTENITREFTGIVGSLLVLGRVNSFIIDMRNNPGGFVDVVQSLVGFWISKDSILCYAEKRHGIDIYYPFSPPFGITIVGLSAVPLEKYPTVVLVNSNSASAAEMFAAALKDYHKAIIIGEGTFKKGRMQERHNFSDGSVLLLIYARFTSPHNHTIDRVGVMPDIVVVQDTTAIDTQMAVAMAYLKGIWKK